MASKHDVASESKWLSDVLEIFNRTRHAQLKWKKGKFVTRTEGSSMVSSSMSVMD